METSKENLSRFLKSGIIVLAVLSILMTGVKFLPQVISVSSSKDGRELPIYCVDKGDTPQISLSFDAAWGNEDTTQILDILSKYNIKVTFFMTGGWVESFPDDVKAIASAGHDLANHSENHKHMSELNAEECESELMKVHNKIKELTGVEMNLFRPPYGDYNNNLLKSATKCNYYTIQWDVDSLDWKNYGTENLINTVVNHKNLGNGSIILMHNGAKYTKDALEEIIIGLQSKGFELVPISQLIHKDNYYMNHEGRQIQKIN